MERKLNWRGFDDEILGEEIDFDFYTIGQIEGMIRFGQCTEKDVVMFYNNKFWRDVHE